MNLFDLSSFSFSFVSISNGLQPKSDGLQPTMDYGSWTIIVLFLTARSPLLHTASLYQYFGLTWNLRQNMAHLISCEHQTNAAKVMHTAPAEVVACCQHGLQRQHNCNNLCIFDFRNPRVSVHASTCLAAVQSEYQELQPGLHKLVSEFMCISSRTCPAGQPPPFSAE